MNAGSNYPTGGVTIEELGERLIDGDPWVEVDGMPIDWRFAQLPSQRVMECADNTCGEILDGVIECMNTPYGVERCDVCGIYDGDLSAAQALAEYAGGEVRVHPDND